MWGLSSCHPGGEVVGMGRNISRGFRKADRLVGELCMAHNRDRVRRWNPREKVWATNWEEVRRVGLVRLTRGLVSRNCGVSGISGRFEV